MRTLSPRRAAVFACGLRENSRIARSIADNRLTLSESLLAAAVDRLGLLLWQNSGGKHDRPPSVLERLQGQIKPSENQSFTSGDEFMTRWQKLTGG